MSWYYCLNKQQYGPVGDSAVKNLVASGEVNRNTLFWSEGMASWQPMSATPLSAMLPVGPPPLSPTVPPAVPSQAASADRVKQIKLFFMLWWICMVVGVVLCVTLFGAILGVPALIAGMVFYCMLLYELWRAVQDGKAQTTPGKAIGFLFIPFFNLYWQFVAFWGLSQDLNRYAREHGIAAPRANEALALTGCILACCAIIPYAGILAAIANVIISIIAVKTMCDTTIAIVQSLDRSAI